MGHPPAVRGLHGASVVPEGHAWRLPVAQSSARPRRPAPTPTAALQVLPMKFTVHHMLRVARALELPAGHATLIGPAGSGRRTIAGLAAAVAKCATAPWQERLQSACARGDRAAFEEALSTAYGAAQKGVGVCVVVDVDLLPDPAWLDTVQTLLSVGHVPGLLPPDAAARDLLHFVVLSAPDAGPTLLSFPALATRCDVIYIPPWGLDDYRAFAEAIVTAEPPAEVPRALLLQVWRCCCGSRMRVTWASDVPRVSGPGNHFGQESAPYPVPPRGCR